MTPGIDPAGVTAWFQANVGGVRPPLAIRQIAGGRSNLTYRVTDAAGTSWVLRRPPLHGVLPSAHDMGREHRVISALAGTPVPVPATFGLCQDPAVTGAPFYVMAYVDGIVPRDEATVAAGLDEPARARAADSLVDALVALHRVDPGQVGLGQLGRHHGYLERQLARWQRQLDQARTRPLPALDEVHRRLEANLPAQVGPARIVHGDFRLDNVVLSPAGQVLAVLDWELCTLGDPLADVGLLLVYWAEPGDQTLPLGSAPTSCPASPAAPPSPRPTRPGRVATCRGWTCTWPSPPGSWPSSWRAWSPATPPAPTAPATTAGAASPRWSCSWPTGPWSSPAGCSPPQRMARRRLVPASAGLTIAWSWRSRNQGRRVMAAGGRWP